VNNSETHTLYSYGETNLKTGEDFDLYKPTDFLKISSFRKLKSMEFFDKIYDIFITSNDSIVVKICEMGKSEVDKIDIDD